MPERHFGGFFGMFQAVEWVLVAFEVNIQVVFCLDKPAMNGMASGCPANSKLWSNNSKCETGAKKRPSTELGQVRQGEMKKLTADFPHFLIEHWCNA